MERMTYWCDDGMGGGEWRANVRGVEVFGSEIDRLAAYESLGPIDHLRELVQAEQDGRLVVLPCKVGDTVWYITSTMELCDAQVINIWLNIYTDPQVWLEIKYYSRFLGEYEYESELMLGEDVFLTREEAETALTQNQA